MTQTSDPGCYFVVSTPKRDFKLACDSYQFENGWAIFYTEGIGFTRTIDLAVPAINCLSVSEVSKEYYNRLEEVKDDDSITD
jgi:hypothetical protein